MNENIAALLAATTQSWLTLSNIAETLARMPDTPPDVLVAARNAERGSLCLRDLLSAVFDATVAG